MMRRKGAVLVVSMCIAKLAHADAPLEEGLSLLERSDYAGAESHLSKVTGKDKERADLARARALFEQGKYREARELLSAAKAPAATVFRAKIRFAEGAFGEAIQSLEPLKTLSGETGQEARLLLSELYIRVGRRGNAAPLLHQFANEYSDETIPANDREGLTRVGRAMALYRRAKDANRAYGESEREYKRGKIPANVDLLLYRAELFLEKYDLGHAEELAREALSRAPQRADALALLAKIRFSQNVSMKEAGDLADKALGIHPTHVGAQCVKVSIALRDMDLRRAQELLTSALKANPASLELRSLRAAAYFLSDERASYEREVADILRDNPEYSRVHVTVSDFAEWEHRYSDMVTMNEAATRIDPKDEKAWAELGLTQLRIPDEQAGLASLSRAWALDHFNVRVYNTLEKLYKTWIPTAYETKTHGVFVVRYPKAERAILERYVPQFLARAWGSMKGRYEALPEVPLFVELYENREHFSVRTTGLPNIGIQGVCFGRVVASMSPEGEAFNWGNVLWHELGHVFAIGLSKSHVPRWFTEGLSEYETIRLRPEWRRELDPALYRALQRGHLPNAADMNRAFTHPSEELDMGTAYYAASQMLVFTVERFGMSRVSAALRSWGEGAKTDEVFSRALGISMGEYDQAFRTWAKERLSRYQKQYVLDTRVHSLEEAEKAVAREPRSADALADLALFLFRHRKVEEAERAIGRALASNSKHPHALFLSAKFMAHKKEWTPARLRLEQMITAGYDGYEVRIALAEILAASKDSAGKKKALYAAHAWDPSQALPLRGLFALAEEEHRKDEALKILEKLAPLDQHDRRLWRELLSRLVSEGRFTDAARVGESALFVDVENRDVHLLYAKALEALGRKEEALFEKESAELCKQSGEAPAGQEP